MANSGASYEHRRTLLTLVQPVPRFVHTSCDLVRKGDWDGHVSIANTTSVPLHSLTVIVGNGVASEV